MGNTKSHFITYKPHKIQIKYKNNVSFANKLEIKELNFLIIRSEIYQNQNFDKINQKKKDEILRCIDYLERNSSKFNLSKVEVFIFRKNRKEIFLITIKKKNSNTPRPKHCLSIDL